MKKIIGYLFLITGAFLVFSSIFRIPTIFMNATDFSVSDPSYEGGYAFGQIVSLVVLLIAAFFLLKYGWKWARSKHLLLEFKTNRHAHY